MYIFRGRSQSQRVVALRRMAQLNGEAETTEKIQVSWTQFLLMKATNHTRVSIGYCIEKFSTFLC